MYLKIASRCLRRMFSLLRTWVAAVCNLPRCPEGKNLQVLSSKRRWDSPYSSRKRSKSDLIMQIKTIFYYKIRITFYMNSDWCGKSRGVASNRFQGAGHLDQVRHQKFALMADSRPLCFDEKKWAALVDTFDSKPAVSLFQFPLVYNAIFLEAIEVPKTKTLFNNFYSGKAYVPSSSQVPSPTGPSLLKEDLEESVDDVVHEHTFAHVLQFFSILVNVVPG